MNWQPITTAPKDGTLIILGWSNHVSSGRFDTWRGVDLSTTILNTPPGSSPPPRSAAFRFLFRFLTVMAVANAAHIGFVVYSTFLERDGVVRDGGWGHESFFGAKDADRVTL